MGKKKTDKKNIISSKANKLLPSTIKVNYLKTPNYRTYHVDGIFGGITPSGDLYIELFVQRSVTPKVSVYEITQEGALGKEIVSEREGKEGVIREIESGLVMSVEVARILRTWLDDKIDKYEKLEEEIIPKSKKEKG